MVFLQDFPGGSEGKASACNAGDPGLIPGLGRCPGEGNENPLQYSCLEKSHGQMSLVGYSPWGCKESDTTEQRHLHFHFIYLPIFAALVSVAVRGLSLFVANRSSSLLWSPSFSLHWLLLLWSAGSRA